MKFKAKKILNKILLFLMPNRYVVIKASKVQMRDVTDGLERRSLPMNQKVIRVRGKDTIYTQRLIIQRGEEFKDIDHNVKIKMVKTKVDGKVLSQAVLKPKRPGNIIKVKKDK